MHSGTRTIDQALAKLEEAIEQKKGADLPALETRKQLRLAAGLSRRDLAIVLGVGPGTVHKWEATEHLPRNGNSQVYGAVLQRLAEVAK